MIAIGGWMSDSQASALAPRAMGLTISILILRGLLARAYTMESRWGHAATFLPNPPTLLLQGGKTDSSGSFTYTSAPNSGDNLLIPLDDSFDIVDPPVTLINTTSAPHLAFHTLSTLGGSGPVWDILLFGGDAGSTEPTQTLANSAWRGKVDVEKGIVEWIHEPNGWGNQPVRRLYHSAAGPGSDGKVYITGGLKGDGSGTAFADVYAYNVDGSTFDAMPSLPQGTYGHNSLLLPNGTLMLIGGVVTSSQTGNAATVPWSSAYMLDTTAGAPEWEERNLEGLVPIARRGATLVLNKDGDKAFMFGGAAAAFGSVFGDGWELDLATASWKEVSKLGEGPEARYGHSAVNMGGTQIAVFGGYNQAGPVNYELHIWDTTAGAWVPSYTPPLPSSLPSGQDLPSTGTTSSTPLDRPWTGTQPDIDTKPSVTGSIGDTDYTDRLSVPTSTVSSSASAEAASAASLNTSAKIGLILGVIAVAGIIAGGCLYRNRRRKRRAALVGARSPGSDRPYGSKYGSKEKDGGLMHETNDRVPNMSEKSPMIGLGMGAIGSGIASISSKLAGKKAEDPYIVLHNEAGPMRRSTRRSGNGIRLVGGPRRLSSRYAPITLGHVRSPLDSLRDPPRIDMLGEEDSREFIRRQESVWARNAGANNGQWISARSISGSQEEAVNPFEEGEDDTDDDSLSPPIRGGPVPTPHASRSDLDPLDDYANRRSSALLSAIDATLYPTYSDNSLPRSQHSGQSGSVSDMEEGSIGLAQYASQMSARLLSPAPSEHRPMKRTGTFWQRMAQGGITSLLSRQNSQKGTVRVSNIRDPTPAPALWPINSRDELTSLSAVAGSSYPPTAFKSALEAPVSGHSKGPSLSSIQSAKSMRDMVIVQREPTSSSEEEGVIESGPSPDVSIFPKRYEEDPVASGDMGWAMAFLSSLDPKVRTHTRDGRIVASHRNSLAGGETPGSTIFDSTALVTTSDIVATSTKGLPASQQISPSEATPTKLRPIPPRDPPRPGSPGAPSLSTPGKSAEPPSGSPVPSPLVSHRRAVKDVVNSINKRGGGLPLAFASATSASPLPNRGGDKKRPTTMYEAVKRERLLVTNPDKKREVSRTNSS